MIYRIDIRTAPDSTGHDRQGEGVRHEIASLGTRVGPITTWRIFLIQTSAPREQVQRIATELLADPVVEKAVLVDRPAGQANTSRIEVHLKPGVMDPVAASTEMAIRDMGLPIDEVRTGRAFVIQGTVDRADLERVATRILANPVIESVHFDPFIPTSFVTGQHYSLKLKHVSVTSLTDEQLLRLSREGHLFLSLAEMKAIQTYFREQKREPTDVELETIAQTWSEHCVHKTLKSAVEVEVRDGSGKKIGTRRYGNLIKETIFDSTMELMGRSEKREAGSGEEATEARRHEGTKGNTGNSQLATGNFCLSVFADNAGVVAFDEADAVCFKVETHNHPSAIEPYGGSATGIGGVIRDVLGTGLAAKPIANTDVFCVAFPDKKLDQIPRGVIHPKRILQQVVAGVRDYGNRMGIPTINGAVYFDDRYMGNPLVFCGCVGLIPRDKISKESRQGDAIVVMGGRTGRDGIHGATFSSAELTDTHADEFSHAVQIGNAITEKKVTDVVLQARDRNLFNAITDCGAGGLSSAVGEMGEKIGAEVHLDRVPLKYQGLRYDEIWISEAQERMVLAVPQEKVTQLLKLAESENVEATVIGTFGTPAAQLILHYEGTQVAQMAMRFLHKGIPMPTRRAVVVEEGTKARRHEGTKGKDTGNWQLATGNSSQSAIGDRQSAISSSLSTSLLSALAHPNIASKHWIIRQYDHEVQGGSVVKPLIGPEQVGPSDASVLRPKLGSYRGVAIGCGMAPHVQDPYEMAVWAIDEAIRNVVAVGADPSRTAILDNFCWPSVDDEITMGTLVRACEACRDAALAFGVPFISGKDSLHNQFTNQETGQVLRIPNTLLISAMAVLEDIRGCVTMDLKKPGQRVFEVSAISPLDLTCLAKLHRAMAGVIAGKMVAACHDVSDGGLAVALAEMCIASGLGLVVPGAALAGDRAFVEGPGRYAIELAEHVDPSAIAAAFAGCAQLREVGLVQSAASLEIAGGETIGVEAMTKAWRGTLDW